MICNGVRMKSILDPTFCYTSSLHTDVRKTFERVRREQRETASNEIRSDRKSNVLTWQRGSLGLADLRRAGGAQENGRTQRPS
jgi:hypothetical protein